jgi:hypothetical protein
MKINRRKFISISSLMLSGSAISIFSMASEERPAPNIENERSLPFIQGLWGKGEYHVTPYIAMAASLQKLEHKDRIATLYDFVRGNERDYRLLVLCRMLFTGKTKSGDLKQSEFRRPKIGGGNYLGGSSYTDWPLEPIALVDDVPFLIARGYVLAGSPAESAADYLDYCIYQCDWSPIRFSQKQPSELKAALKNLLGDV